MGLTCEIARAWFEREARGDVGVDPLDEQECEALEAHLSECAACAAWAEEHGSRQPAK